MDKVFKIIGAAVAVGASLILIIPLSVVIGYFTGWVLSSFVGNWICDGLNVLFNTERFVPKDIPAICSAMAVIGGYLRTSVKHEKD